MLHTISKIDIVYFQGIPTVVSRHAVHRQTAKQKLKLIAYERWRFMEKGLGED